MRARLAPDGDPRLDSAGFFRHREHVPHLDNPRHQPRLQRCAQVADDLVTEHGLSAVVDLGCGDGGLLSLLRSGAPCWGYDVRESSVINRRPGIDVRRADFLTEPLDLGDDRTLVVMTEVLEHLDDPDRFLADLPARWLLASSPADETDTKHDHTHVWAWDQLGYVDMLTRAGWTPVWQELVGRFQIVTAYRA